MTYEPISDEVLDRSYAVMRMYDTTPKDMLQRLLRSWMRDNADEAAEVMATLAYMADRDKVLRDGHAAYARGERTEHVVEMERRYQSKRKRNNRGYEQLRKLHKQPPAASPETFASEHEDGVA